MEKHENIRERQCYAHTYYDFFFNFFLPTVGLCTVSHTIDQCTLHFLGSTQQSQIFIYRYSAEIGGNLIGFQLTPFDL